MFVSGLLPVRVPSTQHNIEYVIPLPHKRFRRLVSHSASA